MNLIAELQTGITTDDDTGVMGPDLPAGYRAIIKATYTGNSATCLISAPAEWWATHYPAAKPDQVWHGFILFKQPPDLPQHLFRSLVWFGAHTLLESPYKTGSYAYNVIYTGSYNDADHYVVSGLWNLTRYQSNGFAKSLQRHISSQIVKSVGDKSVYPIAEILQAFTNLQPIADTTPPQGSIGVFGYPPLWYDTPYHESAALAHQYAEANPYLIPTPQ